MTDFIFLRPYAFLLLIPLLILLLLRTKRRAHQQTLIRHSLLSVFSLQQPKRRFISGQLILAIAGICTITGLAAPAYKQPTALQKSDIAEIIVLGMSQSMNADDIPPSRLHAVRQKLHNYLTLSTRQTALLAYTDQSYLITPLTDDHATILHYLASLNPEIMPSQGANLTSGIQAALKMMADNPTQQFQLTVLADQLTVLQAREIAKLLQSFPGHLRLLTTGTAAGSVIQLDAQELLRDAHGQLIVAKTPIDTFASLAKQLNIPLESLADLDRPGRMQATELNRSVMIEQNIGYFLLIPSLLLLVLFQRGYIFIALFCVLPFTRPGQAAPDPYAQYAAGNYQAAAKNLPDPIWKANALYRLGQYEAALTLYSSQPHQAVALYNKGNTLAHLGRLADAIVAYTQALALEPTMKVALDNRNLVAFWLKQQQMNSDEPYLSPDLQKLQDSSIEQSLQFMKNMPDESGSLLKKRLELQHKTDK